MPRKRIKIPQKIADQVLAANRHVCCICHKEGQSVQLHHIDGDPSNNDPENICVLCLPHHDEVTAKPGLGRSYSQQELRIYKTQWEEHCKLEKNKETIVNNYFNLALRVPQLKNPSVMKPFFTNVASGATSAAVNASVDSTGETVEFSTGGKCTAKDFISLILKGTDWPEEGA